MGKIMHGGIEYSGGGGGGGSTVTITPTLSTGTKIADFSIDGQNGELYAPQGGGGTEVIANPTGDPTAELTKVSIGGVIYSLPQGGGGGTNLYDKSYVPKIQKSSANNLITDNAIVSKVE